MRSSSSCLLAGRLLFGSILASDTQLELCYIVRQREERGERKRVNVWRLAALDGSSIDGIVVDPSTAAASAAAVAACFSESSPRLPPLIPLLFHLVCLPRPVQSLTS